MVFDERAGHQAIRLGQRCEYLFSHTVISAGHEAITHYPDSAGRHISPEHVLLMLNYAESCKEVVDIDECVKFCCECAESYYQMARTSPLK